MEALDRTPTAPRRPRVLALRGRERSAGPVPGRRPPRALPLPRLVLALPRLSAAARSVVRAAGRDLRDDPRHEQGRRGAEPARRRLPPARLRAGHLAALPGALPAARVPRRSRRVRADDPRGRRRGHPAGETHPAADDPRDADGVDRHLHGQGVGERHRQGRGLGDVPRPRRRARDRRPLPHHPERFRPRARRALGRRLRRAQHRHSPSARVPLARELVGLRAGRRRQVDLRRPRAACSRGTARS